MSFRDNPESVRSLESRRERLEAAIVSEVAAAEARRLGLADDDAISGEIEQIRADAVRRERELLQNALYQAIRKEVDLSESDVEEYYEKTKRRYAERQIVVRRTRYEDRLSASNAAIRAKDSSSASPAEQIGPLPISKLPASILPEALRLRRVGDRAVAEGDDGKWAVIELVEIDTAKPLPLEMVRDRVETSLRVRAAGDVWQAKLDALRAEAEIFVDESVLNDEAQWTPAEPLRSAER